MYDATQLGWRQSFPGQVAVYASDFGDVFAGRRGADNLPADLDVCPLGNSHVLFYDRGVDRDQGDRRDWAVWRYDPTASGWRGSPDRSGFQGFPGAWVTGGDSFGNVIESQSGSSQSYAVSSLGTSRGDGQPVVLEFGALVTDDNGTLVTDTNGNVTGAMYRLYFRRTHGTRAAVSFMKVDDLVTSPVGETLIDPTIIGYIEGAPPVPRENMAPDESFMDGWNPNFFNSSVTYTTVDRAGSNWSTSRDAGLDVKLKSDASVEGGIGVASGKVSRELSLEASYGFLADNRVGTSQSLIETRTVNLQGYKDPGDGKWRPYNYGQVYLAGLTADVVALKLRGNDRVITYQLVPHEDQKRPHQITFQINPFYTRQGTVDGMEGASPDRYYPNAKAGMAGNSYYKPDEERKLRNDIARRSKEREAFYTQYNANAFNRLPDLDRNALVQRSLCCTYSFTAPGSSDQQKVESSSVSEVSVGGSFHVLGMAGLSVEASAGDMVEGVGAKVSAGLSLFFGAHLNLTVKKSSEKDSSFSLDSTLLISSQIAAGHVRGYDFTTFCLEPDMTHFWDFFNRVVDPRWIQGQAPAEDLEYVQLLQRAMNRPSAPWRILHRITNVDR